MKINRIAVYHVKIPLGKPSGLSGGRLVVAELDSTIVSIETDAGLTGWGEGCPWGASYLPAFVGGLRAGIAELAPVLLGQNPLHLDQINRTMDLALPGHPYVKSPLDMACWDILGQHTGLPLYGLLGGRYGEHIRRLMSIFTGDRAEMVTTFRAMRAQGYTDFSVKVGADVEGDIALINTLLSELAPNESLTFDANRAWLPDQAIMVMNAIDDSRPYFEQPCDTLEQCYTVRRQTRQPIILDECLHTFADVLWAYNQRAAEMVSLKIDRVGGLTKARRIRDFCVEMGLRMDIETCSGTVFTDAAAVHLAMSTPDTHRHATWLCTDYHAVVTGDGGFVLGHGTATPSDAPGLGITPHMAILGDPIAVYEQ